MSVEPRAAAAPRPVASPPGAAAVGRILDLPPLEMTVVLFLRLWSEGPRGRAEVHQELVARLGATEAGPALEAFERFVRALVGAARRPLMRHGIDCPCVGGDEAAAARAVALAAAGEAEEAATLIAWIARPGVAMPLVASAEEAGLRLAAGILPPAARGGLAPPGH